MTARYARILRELLNRPLAPNTSSHRRMIDATLEGYSELVAGGATSTDMTDRQSRLHAAQTLLFDKGPLKSSDGERFGVAAWHALYLIAGSNAHDSKSLAGRVFSEVVRRQLPSGAFLRADPSASPEVRWYHELVLLHAMTTFAVRTSDASMFAASARAADFHLNETQPDHATSQPWALNAFILHAPANPLADGMLEALNVYQPEGFDRATLLLLADSLYCIEAATTLRGERQKQE